LKAEVIHVGDFVYCRSKRYRDQLQLPAEPGLVIEIKRSTFKILYQDDRRSWVPREHLVRMKPDLGYSPLLQKLHFVLKRVDADECELVRANGLNHLSAKIDKIDATTVDELRAFLSDDFVSMVIVPEGMAFMKVEIDFR
jgi:hypothetical protein